MKKWIARHLHYLADRLDDDGAFRATGYTFTFERNRGFVVHDDEPRRGAHIWYRGHAELDKAWNDGIGSEP